MKFLSAMLLTSLISTQVFAAKFSPIGKMTSPAAQKLAQVGLSIIKNQEAFGDSGKIVALAFTKNAAETNFATMKQLSFKSGANSDDSQKDFQNASVKQIVDFAFYAIENQENQFETPFKAARAQLTAALNSIKADKNLEIYGNQHADEDGSWNIIFVFDVKTNQVLSLRIGFFGT